MIWNLSPPNGQGCGWRQRLRCCSRYWKHRPRLGIALGAVVAVVTSGLLLPRPEAMAIPQFARSYTHEMIGVEPMTCLSCHSVTPKLNHRGEQFLARDYRLPEHLEDRRRKTFPVALWTTGRFENREGIESSEAYLPKVELISGGVIGELPLRYFVEWRVVSLETRGDGSRRDRSGRFEDLELEWGIDGRHDLTIGQFRALNQVDVSRRLSISEPLLFSASLSGEAHADPRIQSLGAFSPAGRSPGVSYSFRSLDGPTASDGLFHFITIPFVGELSLPLTREARTEASFELRGPAKGVYLETFYRTGLNSVGIHGFLDRDSNYLVTGVGTLQQGDLYATAGLGVDRPRDASSRIRRSVELKYLPTLGFERWRPGIGGRVESISGQGPVYVPYLVLSGPNLTYSFLIQAEYRMQEGSDIFRIDFSTFF